MATENRRPIVSTHDVISILSDMYGLQTKDVREMPSFEDRNFCVVTENGDTFVLKIMNPGESCDPQKIQTQINVISLLLDNGFLCPQHLPSKTGLLYWTSNFPISTADGPKENCLVRLLTFLPGDMFGSQSDLFSNPMYQRSGVLLAHLHETLQTFPPANLAVDPENEWIAENAERLKDFMVDMKDQQLVESVNDIISRVRFGLGKNGSAMDKGVIHGDFHDFNLIVNPDTVDLSSSETTAIKNMFGIIDFNDICYTYRIFEIGRLVGDEMTSSTFDKKAVLRIGGHVVAGYLSVRDLSVVDMYMLYNAVCISLAQYIVLGEYAFSKQPDNPFVKVGSEAARRWLDELQHESQSNVEKMWWSVLMEYGINRPEWNGS